MKKNPIRNSFLVLFSLLAVFFVAVAATTPPSREWRTVTPANVTNAIPSATTETISSSVVGLLPGSGAGIMCQFTGAASMTGNVTFNFTVSANGTDASTDTVCSIVRAANGTNVVRAFTNLPPDLVGNARYLVVKSIQNASGDAIANVAVSVTTPPVTRY